jgi:hypothetical protein
MVDLQIILQTAAVITAVGVIGAFIRYFYTFARRIETALGNDKDGRSISDRVGRIEHQVYPNGGGSLSDQVKKVETSVTKTTAKLEIIESLLNTILEKHDNQGRSN